jgi:uncharacterized protein (DUF58 family)
VTGESEGRIPSGESEGRILSAEGEGRIPSAYTMSLTLFLVGFGMFVALLTDQSALTFLCAMVFSMAAGAKAWSRVGLSGVRSQLRLDKKKMFPHETLGLTVAADNKKFLPVWLQVKIPLGEALRTGSRPGPLQQDSGLLSYQRVEFEWQLTELRRGVHPIGPVQLEAGDLLGFYTSEKQADFSDIIVYPRLVALSRIPFPRRDFFGKPGINSPVEDPTYIHGTRDYQCGRAARYIHWKASARHGRLMEKLCEPAEREKVLFLVRADRFDEDASGESMESCLEVAASLAVRLDRLRFSVGIATNARLQGSDRATVRISRSPAQLSQVLETMARIEPQPAGDLINVVRRGPPLSWTVTAVCFTYRNDAGSLALRQYFRDRQIPLVTIVCDRSADIATIRTDAEEGVYRLDDIREQRAGQL